MKYIRKIGSVIIAFILLASFAIGIGVIFAVKNVNVTLQSYTYASESEEARSELARCKTAVLGSLRGTIISFVSNKDVETAVDAIGGYTLVEVKKIYPCTVNVTIREREEAYVIKSGPQYLIYDTDGVFLRSADDEAHSYNPLDNAPNVRVYGAEEGDDMALVSYFGGLFKENFALLRSSVESITVEKARPQISKDKIIFSLRCGLNVEITDYENKSKEKMNAAYLKFSELSGEQKLSGRIYVYGDEEEVRAAYDRLN